MLKIILDMNLSPLWKDVLKDHVEVLHWTEIGKCNATDEEILMYAKNYGYAVMTNDSDFGTILAATHFNCPSVLLIRSLVLDPQMIGDQVINCLRTITVDLENGALVSYDLKKSRIRRLPI